MKNLKKSWLIISLLIVFNILIFVFSSKKLESFVYLSMTEKTVIN